jgi:hypothetical protein
MECLRVLPYELKKGTEKKQKGVRWKVKGEQVKMIDLLRVYQVVEK